MEGAYKTGLDAYVNVAENNLPAKLQEQALVDYFAARSDEVSKRYGKALTTPDGGAVVSQFAGPKFDALVVVNRSPVREMTLKIDLDPSAVRVREDGSTTLAKAYGGSYAVLPGAAEMFVLKR